MNSMSSKILKHKTDRNGTAATFTSLNLSNRYKPRISKDYQRLKTQI